MNKNQLISILLPDLRGGGAERLHLNLAKNWLAQGYKVDFVLMHKHGELLSLISNGIGVVDLRVSRLRQLVFPLERYLRKARPNIVIAAMWPLTSISVVSWLLAGKPGKLFLSDHSQLSISCVHELKTPKWLLKFIMRCTYPLASGVIAVSEGVKQDMCKLGNLFDTSVRVIYNPSAIGVSPHRENLAIKQQLWGTGFNHNILSVGTLKKQKDHETLIKAFALLPVLLNAKLIILGEGPLREELEALVLQLGLVDRVTMPGFVVDPYPWFRSADLFVLSSQWEGFGNVIVEALECGVPIVSTDCLSGPAEILENGRYGKLVPIHNPNALAVAMTQSLNTTHDLEILMRRAKDFSLEKIADEYMDLFFSKRS